MNVEIITMDQRKKFWYCTDNYDTINRSVMINCRMDRLIMGNLIGRDVYAR